MIKDYIKTFLARTELRNPFSTLFTEIEFETNSYCNRKCSYCPNVKWERFGDESGFFMKEVVFKELISQLKDVEFQGQIAPHLYNEPLSDPRLVWMLEHVRSSLPNAKIKITTNGDYLDAEKYNQLIGVGVNHIFISKHGKRLPRKLRELLDSLDEDEKKEKIVLNDFYNDFSTDQKMFTNRGGDVKLKEIANKKPPAACVYATYPVINTYGDMILCCQDFHNNYIFGNIMDAHILDIWNDQKNIKLRKQIYKGYFDLDICKKCTM